MSSWWLSFVSLSCWRRQWPLIPTFRQWRALPIDLAVFPSPTILMLRKRGSRDAGQDPPRFSSFISSSVSSKVEQGLFSFFSFSRPCNVSSLRKVAWSELLQNSKCGFTAICKSLTTAEWHRSCIEDQISQCASKHDLPLLLHENLFLILSVNSVSTSSRRWFRSSCSWIDMNESKGERWWPLHLCHLFTPRLFCSLKKRTDICGIVRGTGTAKFRFQHCLQAVPFNFSGAAWKQSKGKHWRCPCFSVSPSSSDCSEFESGLKCACFRLQAVLWKPPAAFGSHTFVPIKWMCKKQTAVSHSSTESEIISCDTRLRLDGLRALELWDLIGSVFGSVSQVSDRSGQPDNDVNKHHQSQGKIYVMENIDSVSSNVQSSRQEALLYVFEDNEAVIKMIIKRRSPTMRHVSRTP